MRWWLNASLKSHHHHHQISHRPAPHPRSLPQAECSAKAPFLQVEGLPAFFLQESCCLAFDLEASHADGGIVMGLYRLYSILSACVHWNTFVSFSPLVFSISGDFRSGLEALAWSQNFLLNLT